MRAAVVRGGGPIVDVTLRPERVFSGRVVDTRGDPIVGASVLLRTTFRRKAAFPPSWGGHAGPFTLGEGEVREGVDVVRLAPVTLRLRVVDAAGQGIKGVTANVLLGNVDAVVSNADGSIALRLPPEGQKLIARLPEGRVAVALEGATPRKVVPVGGMGGDSSHGSTTRQARFSFPSCRLDRTPCARRCGG